MIFEKLQGMVAEQLGMDPGEITENSRLKEDLNADSASIMMLVMDIESEFNIEIEDDAIELVKTVGDMVRYIKEKQA
ncbi:MAG: acyl carrier protein [Clostridia bacterium]|nr:acyl carrier protein [Clostridia bacterium]